MRQRRYDGELVIEPDAPRRSVQRNAALRELDRSADEARPVDVSVAGRGVGAWLLRDAMTQTLAASDTIGVRAMLVHALDDEERRFFLPHGLESSCTDPLHLMILIKDIAAGLKAERH